MRRVLMPHMSAVIVLLHAENRLYESMLVSWFILVEISITTRICIRICCPHAVHDIARYLLQYTLPHRVVLPTILYSEKDVSTTFFVFSTSIKYAPFICVFSFVGI